MVSYIRGPAYKVAKSGINFSAVKAYTGDLIFWGVAGAGAVATFTDGVPLFKNTFYTKIPYFGEHWVYNPDPEDVPV
ncbi:Ubiquinol-cytochrome-c reductase complex subunit (QCR10) family protein [Clavispora lusitaniae]|uniref:Ubiquinol--cytochrome-c reductase subunit n=1 Tax=Clavispora lusitaniae TaxID=36911 RepID=A0AA91T440_CLALS|nr:Ubiquinol-cytochrome-c reductase complex subunit (QCR10) family protein [Clavispora lusitaniae]OVF10969.1 putative ubiquinol--cytochrome-c reductase subunit [Clavispora lusitaniae]